MRRMIIMAAFVCLLAGCQATSTAAPYHPTNCAMVGSSCGRTHHFF